MDLNAEQRRAAEFDGGHALVLAGAGTGKTRVIIARAATLLRGGVGPRRIAILTFTRRAAKEITSRLSSQAGTEANRVYSGTFHHFCLTIMHRMPADFGIDGYQIIDRDDSEQLMKFARADAAEQRKHFPKASHLADLYSYSRNVNQRQREYLKRFTQFADDEIEEILGTFTKYATRKRENRYLDFDDILYRFAKVLTEAGQVRARLRHAFDHLLVDEMQDTNPLQWLILDALRDPAKLFCVGDDAQSIYGFRGADFKNVHSFRERVPGSTVLKLEQNYRSTQEILDLPNWLLSRSKLNYHKHLVGVRGTGIRPKLIDFDSEWDEADWIANDLLRRHAEGQPWRDHMLLIRTAWSARTTEAKLAECKIPYRFIGGTSFFASAHVKDLLSLLRAVSSPRDELAWMRYLTLWKNIGEQRASNAIREIRTAPDSQAAIDVAARCLSEWPDCVPPLRIVHQAWLKPSAAVSAAGRALEPLMQAIYGNWDSKNDFPLLERLASQHHSVTAFIETYTLDPITESGATRPITDDAVNLITVHSAKGTEAHTCYVLRAEPGMYPHVRALGDFDDEEEDRRVLYVAMTRAMDELILTRTLRVRDSFTPTGGRFASCSPEGEQYFLDSLPEELADREVLGTGPIDFDNDVISPIPG